MISIAFSIILSIVTADNFYCKLGKKADMPPQPSCGIPVRIRLPLPNNGRRFEFRRVENPNLSGYFHRKRNGSGPVKKFSNLINLYKVDLYLCPDDFKTPKTLLFHLISHNGLIKKYQCKLGIKDKNLFLNNKNSTKTNTQENTTQNKQNTTQNKQNTTQNKKNTIQNKQKQTSNVLASVLPKPQTPQKPVSPYLITLAWASLAMSILFFIIFTITIYFLKKKIAKLEKTLDEINEISLTMEMPQRKNS